MRSRPCRPGRRVEGSLLNRSAAARNPTGQDSPGSDPGEVAIGSLARAEAEFALAAGGEIDAGSGRAARFRLTRGGSIGGHPLGVPDVVLETGWEDVADDHLGTSRIFRSSLGPSREKTS